MNAEQPGDPGNSRDLVTGEFFHRKIGWAMGEFLLKYGDFFLCVGLIAMFFISSINIYIYIYTLTFDIYD